MTVGAPRWYRSTFHGNPGVVHISGCSFIKSSKEWRMVDGWPQADVISHLATVPWLRICAFCAERMGVPIDHPSRANSDFTPAEEPARTA